MFYVGQKVVCVDAVEHTHFAPPNVMVEGSLDGLREGVVYTVRSVGRRHPRCPFGVLVWLTEIVRPIKGDLSKLYGELGYDPRRFRPLIERKTDISIFTDMLKPKTEQVSA
jgi:hypothetical protein